MNYACDNEFRNINYPVWWPWAMNHPIIQISTNENNCAPDSAQFNVLDNDFNINDGVWRIFRTYNFIQAAGAIIDTTPLDNDTLNLLSPKTALQSGNAIPTLIMHGLSDLLVPYTFPPMGLEPVNGMQDALNSNGGLLVTGICYTGPGGNCSPMNLSNFTDKHCIRRYAGAGHGWVGANVAMYRILRHDVLIWLFNH